MYKIVLEVIHTAIATHRMDSKHRLQLRLKKLDKLESLTSSVGDEFSKFYAESDTNRNEPLINLGSKINR